MKLKTITDEMTAGKGVIGLDDIPMLSRAEMQRKFEETVRDVVIPVMNENALITATKQDIADIVLKSGSGDMYSGFYDTDGDGTVDSADNGINEYAFAVADDTVILTGKGVNGCFIRNGEITTDRISLNGTEYSLKCGGENEIEFTDGAIYLFRADRDNHILNFYCGDSGVKAKIIASVTEPRNPRENTVWIQTAENFHGYCIQSKEPERAENLLWLKSGASGVSLKLTDKNPVTVEITASQLYTQNKWTACPVKIFTEGEWKSTERLVFHDGEFSDSYTVIQAMSQYGTNTVTVTDVITLYSKAYSGAYFSTLNVRLSEKIDVTGYSAIQLRMSEFSSRGYMKMAVGLTESDTGVAYSTYTPTYTEFVKYANKNDTGTVTIDTSDIAGEYYLMFTMGRYNGADSRMTVSDIRLLP